MKHHTKILISIVIYNKKISDLFIFKNNIQNKNLNFFIYDNSKISQEIPNFKNTTLYYEHDEKNSGVSKAYNKAYQKAKEINANALLILDQDTSFKIKNLDLYLKYYNKYGDNYIYAPVITDANMQLIYSPFILNHFIGKVQNMSKFKYEEQYDITHKSVINSGLFIPLSIFEKIGLYNEKLKLDFSDVYFIEKYKKVKKYIILIDLYMQHSLSGNEGRDFKRELGRYVYYTIGARELGTALHISTFWIVLRRMFRLTLKYKHLSFITIFINNFLRGKDS